MFTFFDDFGRWTGPTIRIDPETGEWCLVSTGENKANPVSEPSTSSGIEPSLDAKAAAKILGCSTGQVRKLVNNGKLGHHWIGKNLRFRKGDLEQFWASQVASGSDKTSTQALSGNRVRKASETKGLSTQESSLPTRRDVDELWR